MVRHPFSPYTSTYYHCSRCGVAYNSITIMEYHERSCTSTWMGDAAKKYAIEPAAVPTKRQITKTRNDLIDLLKELET